MEIKTLTVGEMAENVYLLYGEDEVAVIDPGAQYERIKAELGGKKCKHVLITHAHFDHIGAVAALGRDGAKIYMHGADVAMLGNSGNLAALFGQKLDTFSPDVILSDGDVLNLCGKEIKVISTPGHTDGSVCYVTQDVIFSGDTLFYLSVGRTDFPTGSSKKLHESVRNKLFTLSGDYKVLPGHGCPTSLSFEKKNNPYV